MLLAIVMWLVIFLLGLIPVVHHFRYGLLERRRSILGYFDNDAAKTYFDQFYFAESGNFAPEYATQLARMYDQRFGAIVFLMPLGLYFAALAVTVTVLVATALSTLKIETIPSAVVENTAAAALAGAYLWIVSDLIQRYRQRDLVPGVLYSATFRIIIAIPMAYAIAATMPKGVGAATLAFLLGAFPTDTLFLIMRRTVSKKFGLGDDAEANKKPELELLQGVNTAIAEKLSDIGLTTMLQLAYEDPIQLTMRTNLNFSFVVDLVSQALAGLYIDLAKARKYSLRGAQEAANLYHNLSHGPAESRERARAILVAASAELDIPPDSLQNSLREISKDPYTEFLGAIWH